MSKELKILITHESNFSRQLYNMDTRLEVFITAL